MKNHVRIIGTILLLFSGCAEDVDGKKEFSLIHKRMIGEWKEHNTDALWEFRRYDMKWRSFEHYYVVDSTQLTISNLQFEIKKQAKDTVLLLSPDKKVITLVRCQEDSLERVK